ncbi:hypothetical protein FRC12_002356 [Ceratobasidium sp. 428]|nr:hypothetical protein FRC12_002356 [Ceratobasidium sp. 428]
MRPVLELDPVVPALQLPSGGTIDISSSDPPVAGSSKHYDAISSSDAVGTEDPNREESEGSGTLDGEHLLASQAAAIGRLVALDTPPPNFMFFFLPTFPSGFYPFELDFFSENCSSPPNRTGCDDTMGLGLFVRTCYRPCYVLL